MIEGLAIGDVTIRGRVFIAPMTGVSDLPFRRAASKLGAPYVATEMVACEAFAQARPDVLRRAAVGDGLSPMVMQLVGREPHWVAQAAKLSADAGADIIDLNMGCPAKEVTGVLSGSALMRDLELAERLIAAAVQATARPVTLKMRLGWDNDSRNAPELAARAECCGVMAVTVHGRTRAQFYKGEVDWRAVAEVKSAVRIPVIVNGDVVDVQTARVALEQSGADAVMIGRGACGRPWLAPTLGTALATGREVSEPDSCERLGIVLDHLRDSVTFYGDSQGLRIFRKHLARYVETAPFPIDHGKRSAARSALCRMTSAADVEAALTALWSGEPLRLAA
ncbi:MAG TPA: tRNA dihydrouridine synthase DusB [Rhizomicrobium sp.]|jgi:nifR3 family TIM-barrel protein|nr:tRNA dihydrouridine synthase DusB [Rhizomicrobium sp.]